jgi:hypothetical protein
MKIDLSGLPMIIAVSLIVIIIGVIAVGLLDQPSHQEKVCSEQCVLANYSFYEYNPGNSFVQSACLCRGKTILTLYTGD